MALIKKVAIDEITVQENGIVLVREATKIIDGGNEISKTFHRTSYVPGSDVSETDAKVQTICAAAWTPEVVALFNQTN
jgi:hypothetical protein